MTAIGRVARAIGVAVECLMARRRIVVGRRILKQCFTTSGYVAGAGSVLEERPIASSDVV